MQLPESANYQTKQIIERLSVGQPHSGVAAAVGVSRGYITQVAEDYADLISANRAALDEELNALHKDSDYKAAVIENHILGLFLRDIEHDIQNCDPELNGADRKVKPEFALAVLDRVSRRSPKAHKGAEDSERHTIFLDLPQVVVKMKRPEQLIADVQDVMQINSSNQVVAVGDKSLETISETRLKELAYVK